VRLHKKYLRQKELEMSIETNMMRTIMVENFVDILKAFIQKNLLIDIVPVIDDAGAYTKNMHWRYTRFNI